ncbi:MAG TPA: SRPBCC family protein [Burkholderiales bacterium]|jgi:uncharacterized protein YndB with AHSA1/START domain|nr:SRPBCC family protein [Burkholderiales bacterium]
MNERTVEHGSFTIERTFEAPPARVFAAWADPKAKAAWFAGPEGQWKQLVRQMEFRIGGREKVKGEFATGRVSEFDASYHDIVTNRRIVYSYTMQVDEKRISVSLATIEFEPVAGGKTKLILTEQGAYLDGGFDGNAGREKGTRSLIDNLQRFVAQS